MRRAKMSKYCALGLGFAATACTNVPELKDRITPDVHTQAYPALIPLEQAFEPQEDPGKVSQKLEETLNARAARLRARAAALQSAAD